MATRFSVRHLLGKTGFALWTAVAVGILLLSAGCGSADTSQATAAAEKASRAAQDAAQAVKDAAAAAQQASMAAERAADAASAGDGAGEQTLAAAQEATSAARNAAAAAQEASLAAQKAVSGPTMRMEEPGSLVLYSGRSESLVGPIIQQFREATGIDIQVKYGSTSEMAATLQEESRRSPADVFWAQDPGALGALSEMFKPLPSDVTLAVPEWARASDGSWVGVSGRARVIVYNTNLSEDELPMSVQELTDPKWKGRIGWPPTNASFRVMVTAMRHLWGEDETRAWLEGMLANDVKVFPKNTPIVDAAGKGEVDVGLGQPLLPSQVPRRARRRIRRTQPISQRWGTGQPRYGRRNRNSQDQPKQRKRRSVRKVPAVEGRTAVLRGIDLRVPADRGRKDRPAPASNRDPERAGAIDFALLDDLAGTEDLLRSVGVIP